MAREGIGLGVDDVGIEVGLEDSCGGEGVELGMSGTHFGISIRAIAGFMGGGCFVVRRMGGREGNNSGELLFFISWPDEATLDLPCQERYPIPGPADGRWFRIDTGDRYPFSLKEKILYSTLMRTYLLLS